MAKAGLNQQIVTEAAAAIVDADGIGALTLARLAGELGVASPSLYKHVAGIDDLKTRVATLSLRRLADEVTSGVMGRSGRDALSAMAARYRRYAIDHPGLYSLTLFSPDPGSSEQQAQAQRAPAVFRALVTSYGMPEEQVLHAVRIVRAGLHGFVDVEIRSGFYLGGSVEDSFSALVEALHVFLDGLGRAKA